MPETMRGLYPIIVTPFTDDYEVDYLSLRALVEYLVQAGAHGLGLANGSEVLKLTEFERAEVTRVMVEQAKGRVPVVINTSGSGTQTALCYSRAAAENGADALMLMPPLPMGMGRNASAKDLKAFLCAIGEEVGLPIFVQSAGSLAVDPQVVNAAFRKSPAVCYIKEECMPTVGRIASAVREADEGITVFGGMGGHYLLQELQRGSQGTMPGCEFTAPFRQVWDAYEAGDLAAAKDIHSKIRALGAVSSVMLDGFFHFSKRCLAKRGVIATAKLRPPAAPWPDDERTQHEVEEAIDQTLAWHP